MSHGETEAEVVRGPVFLAALRAAAARVPVWLLCWLVPLLLAAAVAAPWVDWFAETAANRYEPGDSEAGASGEVLATLRESFRADHGAAMDALGARSAQVAAVLGLVAMLFGAFSAGGWLQVFLERASGHSVRRFLWGGSRYFWRFVRVWLLTLLLLAAVSWIVLSWPWNTLVAGMLFGAPGGETEVFTSERTAVLYGWLQTGVHALLFALVLAWGDFTRTRMALQDSSSALLAGLGTVILILVHPVRTLRPMLLILIVEALVLWGAGSVSWGLNAGLGDGGGWGAVFSLFLVGQLALAARAICRGARYHAAVRVSRRVVPPLSRPDPWASRVGGPGGPQYPIDESDDYGVSL
ncbi:MAG: hypothetical protein AAF682_08930 [Planctomycetota bacterium]